MDERSVSLILSQFSNKRALVLGDLILDRYWWGEANRLSPEAPVPVLRKRHVTARPGGAANTAANLVALGAQVELIGLVGADSGAVELADSLTQCGVDASHLIVSPARPTTTKTRIIALNQHIVRVDEEDTTPLDVATSSAVASDTVKRMQYADVIVISDYAKGMLTPELLAYVLSAAAVLGKSVFVDPKGLDYRRYHGASYLKPNRLELGLLTSRTVRDHQETLEAGRFLISQLNGSHLLVTEGADGMTLFTAAGAVYHMPNFPRQVYDVTGAGDTVLATFSLAISSGAEPLEAMWLATRAAEVAIGIVGAAIITRSMLEEAAQSRIAVAATEH